ncbi:hypothetical protein [Arcanobacterium ihumii]|uniref:hypothetical protein n=1 Tax=Arcanobacterium ihumii TaxID=2138162 RepID=UPI000F52490A|nr:hypothetical protein [Arcanobacterium ihumii]
MSSRKRYVILTPFDKTEVVAAILRLRGIDAEVVMTNSGVVVYHDLPVKSFDDWDISELLGPSDDATLSASDDSMPDSDNPQTVAAHLSNVSQFGVVLMVAELGDDVGGEAGVSGLVTAHRVMAGELGEEIAPGLLLNSIDPVIEQIVLGSANVEGALATNDLKQSFLDRLLRKKRSSDGDTREAE